MNQLLHGNGGCGRPHPLQTQALDRCLGILDLVATPVIGRIGEPNQMQGYERLEIDQRDDAIDGNLRILKRLPELDQEIEAGRKGFVGRQTGRDFLQELEALLFQFVPLLIDQCSDFFHA